MTNDELRNRVVDAIDLNVTAQPEDTAYVVGIDLAAQAIMEILYDSGLIPGEPRAQKESA